MYKILSCPSAEKLVIVVMGAIYPHIDLSTCYPHILIGSVYYAQSTWIIVIGITTKQLNILQLFVCVEKRYICIATNYHNVNRTGRIFLCNNLLRSLEGEGNDLVASFLLFTVLRIANCVIFLGSVDRDDEKMIQSDSLRSW